VEVNAVETITDLHKAQLLTYLRLTKKKVGLILNFNTVLLKDGIFRQVL
jgi:GxxExxY protein